MDRWIIVEWMMMDRCWIDGWMDDRWMDAPLEVGGVINSLRIVAMVVSPCVATPPRDVTAVGSCNP